MNKSGQAGSAFWLMKALTYSVSVTSTQMLVVYMRLISLTDFKRATHFLTTVHVLDRKAATVTETILKALKERKIPIGKVTAFGSDCGSAMSSNKEGGNRKLKETEPKCNRCTLHSYLHTNCNFVFLKLQRKSSS